MNLDTYNSLPDDLKALIDDEEMRTELETKNLEDGICVTGFLLQWSYRRIRYNGGLSD